MHRASRRRTGWVAVTLCIALAGPVAGFYFDNKIAWGGPVTLQLQLGPAGELMDGSADWDQSAIDAMALWNQHLRAPVQFQFVRNSSAPVKRNDKVNNVFFSDDIFGEPFPANTAAVTLLRWTGTKMSDADVIFNRAYSFNSYRGPNRGGLLDFHRVALHEFGHVLGLNHPDVAGQSVSSIMNSYVGDTEDLQADDVAGIETIYGKVDARSAGSRLSGEGGDIDRAGFVNFPGREDVSRFGAELETRFRDEWRQPSSVGFVDTASAAVWTTEYVRYRVQSCSHADAIQRTFMQMDGLGIQPVCDVTSRLNFPERSDLFDFRGQLERKYRDDFKAQWVEAHVSAPADAAWLQEYLRYRVSLCSHDEASSRVFDQIAGRGVAPTCQ